ADVPVGRRAVVGTQSDLVEVTGIAEAASRQTTQRAVGRFAEEATDAGTILIAEPFSTQTPGPGVADLLEQVAVQTIPVGIAVAGDDRIVLVTQVALQSE